MSLGQRIIDLATRRRINFLDEGVTLEVSALLDRGSLASGWLERQEGNAHAMVLSNSSACVSCFLGAICSGLEVISVPLPPRGGSLDWYQQFVQSICRKSGSPHLLLDAEVLALLPPLSGVLPVAYEQLLSEGAPARGDPSSFSLTQYTSGSTSKPKGVVLSGEAILANIDALLSVLDIQADDNSCSWLPLSHDMGLIGMLLSSCVALDRADRVGTLYLMRPEHFLRKPGDWLRACSEFTATITASPDFGLSLATKRTATNSLDLSRLRVCVTGGEPVSANTLRSFSQQFASVGLSPHALSPAYGLAEAALAVTMTPVHAEWRSLRVDPAALADREIAIDDSGIDIVSAGGPLPQYEVEAGQGHVSALRFRGPSTCSRYVGGHELPIDRDGWFATSDLGFAIEGHIYPVGREDDVLVIAGRNIYAIDIEAALTEVEGIRPGRVTVVEADGALTVLAEVEREFQLSDPSLAGLVRQVRIVVANRVAVSPDRVIIVERGQLPMTASGKTRRNAVVQALHSGSLPALSVSD